jgi:hypothetical protein
MTMSDQQHDNTSDSSTPGGLSRRNALKAGVGVGVGVAAWSGSQITSVAFAGSFAGGCTFFERIELEGCRNTDQGQNSYFRYHEIKNVAFPAGYGIVQNITEGTKCEDNGQVIFSHPTNVDCQLTLQFYSPAGPGTQCAIFRDEEILSDIDANEGTSTFILACPTLDPSLNISSLKYVMFLECSTDLDDVNDCAPDPSP